KPLCLLVPGERFELPTNGLQNRILTLILLMFLPACCVCVAQLDRPRHQGVSCAIQIQFAGQARRRFSAAASSALSSAPGHSCPKRSAVSTMVEWPRRSCTFLSGSSRPPSARRLIHHEAEKWRRAGRAVYLAFPLASVMPAAVREGEKPRPTMLLGSSTFPLPLGSSRPSAPFGHLAFHSRSVFTTSGDSGTVRSPAWDLGLPMAR